MKDTNSNNSYVELQIQICNLYLEIASVRIRHDALKKEKKGKI